MRFPVTVRPAQSHEILNRAGGAAGSSRAMGWRIKSYAGPLAGMTAEVDLYGEIGIDWDPDTGERVGMSAQRFLAEVQGLPLLGLFVLRVCSPGGNTVQAMAMHSIIQGLQCRKVGIVDGFAASAATIVLMACDEIQIPAGAIMMIHDPLVDIMGNAAQLSAAIEDLARVKQAIIATYAAKNSKMSADEISAAMAATTYYVGADAVEAGFADKLTAPAPITNLAALDPAALKGAPEAFVLAVKAQLEAAAAQEETMKPEEIAKSFETLTASLATLTETVNKLAVPAAEVKPVPGAEKTQAEKDAESLSKVKAFAEEKGAGVLAIFNKYVEAGSPVEAIRTAVFGAAATADAEAKPVPGGKAPGAVDRARNHGDVPGQGLTIGRVSAWYDMLNKR